MEFIPIEKYNKNNTKKAQKTENKKVKSIKKCDDEGSGVKRVKEVNMTEKQILKKKCKATSVLKKKKTIPKRNFLRNKNIKKEKDDNEIKVDEENDDENEGEENEIDGIQSEEGEKEEGNGDIHLKKKCDKLNEKKKNRLFLKLKKKIYSEAQIKELHPDIRNVIFPRKKNSRWCWAVFASEEKAIAALTQLIKNKDIFVNKPNPHEKVIQKRKEKMKTVLRKKEAQKKLKKMWM